MNVVFFALRTYAIWECQMPVFVLVLVAYIPGFVLHMVHNLTLRPHTNMY
jgi:hypothetical protein